MKPALAIWAASLRARYRADARTRVALLLSLLIGIAGGSWSAHLLALQLSTWQRLGSGALLQGLWLYCLGTWSGLGALALISLRRAFATDEPLLLFLLPLPPATRFRALFGSFFLEQLLSLALLQAMILLYVLLSVLGWSGFPWFLLIQVGTIITVCILLLITFLIVGYLLNSERRRARRVLVSLGIVGIMLLTSLLLLVFRPTLNVQALRPESVLFLFILLLFLFLGPCAAPLGRLYLTAFRTTQGWNRGQRAFTLPGLSWLTQLLAQRRTLTAAFAVRAVQNQSRNFFFWFRLLAVWLMVLFGLPSILPLLLHLGLTAPLVVITAASSVTLLHILEPGVCMISGEGNRFTLYLTAPLSPRQILRARLLSCLLPLLLEALAISLYLSWQLHIGLMAAGPILLAVGLLVTTSTSLLMLGSAWDLDLHEVAEGAMQALLLEEVPLTARKMLLSFFSLFSAGGMLLLLCRLSLALALLLLAMIASLLIAASWQLSLRLIALKRR